MEKEEKELELQKIEVLKDLVISVRELTKKVDQIVDAIYEK